MGKRLIYGISTAFILHGILTYLPIYLHWAAYPSSPVSSPSFDCLPVPFTFHPIFNLHFVETRRDLSILCKPHSTSYKMSTSRFSQQIYYMKDGVRFEITSTVQRGQISAA